MRSNGGVKHGSRRDFSVRIKDVTKLFSHTYGFPHHLVFNEQQKSCPQRENRNGFKSLITEIISGKNNKRGGVQERGRCAKIVQGMHHLSVLEITRDPSFFNRSWGI
jgi:hypothetical protein